MLKKKNKNNILLDEITNLKRGFDELNNKLLIYNKNITEQINSMQNHINDLSNINNVLLNDIKSELTFINPETMTLDNNEKRIKVLLMGFYGAPNLGDELMLEVFVNKIKKNENIDLTVMLSENKGFDITHYKGFKILHYPKSILDINIFANYFDVIIVGGGALLDDNDYNSYINGLTLSNTIINLSMRMIAFNKKVILYGLSTASKFTDKNYIKKLDYIINNATYVSLRDTNSINKLKKYNIDTSRIKLVDDVVFSYDYSNFSHMTNKTFIKIAICYILNDKTINILKENLNWITSYLKNKNIKYKIVLIPFYEYCNNDTIYYKNIIEDNFENIIISDYPYNYDDIKSLLVDVDYMISMRYHGTLLANLFGIQNINILYDVHSHYDNKMNYLYDNYHFIKNQILFSKLDKNNFLKSFETMLTKKNKAINKSYYIKSNSDIDHALSLIQKDKK